MSETSLESELYLALKSGSVVIGARKVIKQLKTGDKPKLVILASNAPPDISQEVKYLTRISGVPLYEYPGKSLDLGRAFKKPFFVSVAAIMDEGESRVLEMLGAE